MKHKSRQPGPFARDRHYCRRSVTVVEAEAETSMIAFTIGDSCWARHDVISLFVLIRLSAWSPLKVMYPVMYVPSNIKPIARISYM